MKEINTDKYADDSQIQTVESIDHCLADTKKKPVKLGPRLQTIASYVPVGAVVGDIGTDHAYLPLYLIQNGIISQAVGVDVHKGPYESALENVKAYGLKDAIRIRLGNGLIPLEAGEVDTLVIAGMGGVTVLEILASKPVILNNIQTLILQPQGAESRVRYELLSQGWHLMRECLVAEDDRIYTVLHFSRSDGLSKIDIEQRIDRTVQDIRENWLDNVNNSIEKSQVSAIKISGELSASEEPTMETEIEKNEQILKQLIWHIGPLIVERRDVLIRGIITESSTNVKRVVLEMMRADRVQVTAKATQLKKEIAMLEVLEKWLYQ